MFVVTKAGILSQNKILQQVFFVPIRNQNCNRTRNLKFPHIRGLQKTYIPNIYSGDWVDAGQLMMDEFVNANQEHDLLYCIKYEVTSRGIYNIWVKEAMWDFIF